MVSSDSINIARYDMSPIKMIIQGQPVMFCEKIHHYYK